MGRGVPQNQESDSGDNSVVDCADTHTCNASAQKGGKAVSVGTVFVKTIRHFWPELNSWIGELPDTRFFPFVEYDQKFLLWWGILLYSCNLGSSRQLDFELRDHDSEILENVNRLAATAQKSLPVYKTLLHYLGHIDSASLAQLRSKCIRRLIRSKVLDDFRLQGAFVIALDGTGHLTFNKRHCKYCLTREYENTTVYHHHVLEAKLVSTTGMALSIATEFIDNSHFDKQLTAYNEKVKQDCELKAFQRLALSLKKDFPQTPFCITGDSIYACGTAIEICKHNHWSFVFTFKPGRASALWEEFQGLLKVATDNSRKINLPGDTKQHYRWVNDLRYEDSEKRQHRLSAIICEEIRNGETTTFAWITSMNVNADNVDTIAAKGGRVRAKIENEGFNTQKNGGYNLEHAYSRGYDISKSLYYLLQIAHIILQFVHKGSLLKKIAEQHKATPLSFWGSLKNISRRLLECFRYFAIPKDVFDEAAAVLIQIRLDSG
jgi:hypothetical protein